MTPALILFITAAPKTFSRFTMYGVFTVVFLGTVVLATVSAQQQCLPFHGVELEVKLKGSISDDPCENVTIDSQLVTSVTSALFFRGFNIPSETLVMAFGDLKCNEKGKGGPKGKTKSRENTRSESRGRSGPRGRTGTRGRSGPRGRTGTARKLDISFYVVIHQETPDLCILSISNETTQEILQNQFDVFVELFSPEEFQRPAFPSTITIAVPLLGSVVDVEFRVTFRGGNFETFCNGTQVSLSRGGSRSRSRGRGRGTGRSGSRAAFELCGMKIIYILNIRICKMHYPI